MPAFSVSPITDVPAPAQPDFPNFIQWQNAGVNLGLPDADTVNCTNGITATRGTGENSNVITLTGDGAGAAAVSLLTLTNPADPPVEEIMLFDGNPFLVFWNAAVDIASDDWSWNADTPGDAHLLFATTGLYRLTMTSFVEAEAEWPDGNTTYGSTIDGVSTAAQARTHTTGDVEDTRIRMQWTDQHFVTITEGEVGFPFYVGLFAKATNTTHVVLFAEMRIVIERIADVG